MATTSFTPGNRGKISSLIRRTAYSTVGATHCTVVVMPRIFFVPTLPSELQKPSKVWPARGACGAGVFVASGKSSSVGGGGRLIDSSCTQEPAGADQAANTA